MSSAEPRVIGTTGMKPKTAVPPGVRVKASRPPSDQTTTGGPGGGAGTISWKTATPITPAAAHSVDARAPHLVLPRQKSAATSKGDKAAKPVKAYCTAREKMVSGARKRDGVGDDGQDDHEAAAHVHLRRLAEAGPPSVVREHVLREHGREGQDLRVGGHHRGHDPRPQEAGQPDRRVAIEQEQQHVVGVRLRAERVALLRVRAWPLVRPEPPRASIFALIAGTSVARLAMTPRNTQGSQMARMQSG